MVDPVKLWESSSSQLNCPQPEEPSQTEGGKSRESKIKYYLLRVVTEDCLQELVSDRLGKEVENCEQERLVHAEEHKVPPGSPKENIFQNNDLGCQKGEKSQNDSLQMAFEETQTLESGKSCCSVGNFQDNVISGRPSLKQSTYQCNVCKRCFSLSSSLFNHQCIPIAKTLHKCMQCERVFGFSSSLIQHQKLHHRQKASLKCPECGDQFRCRAGLTVHRRTHKREKKPYMCSQCNQSFHCTSDLMTHDHI
ncbi:ZNF22 protein, partial [Odontophorus gujanensis]|nr:ZNF22 protein [Odontophorus gujanensis]